MTKKRKASERNKRRKGSKKEIEEKRKLEGRG